MSLQTNTSQTLLLSVVIFLTGCQQYQRTEVTPKPIITAPTENTVQPSNQFSIQGKIGIKTPAQSGSAFFTWQQDQDTFNIELAGALGIGKTNIQGNSHHATLMNAKTGTIESESPEQLLKQATGWNAPIGHLVAWIQGQAATPQAQIQRDPQNRISKLDEDQWQVDFSYNTTQPLPYKIILKQPLENNQENRITLVIENR
ncbi:lipoprotein insertase outer membrane protein LolB [Acinetobacter rathckeae]|uniref:lipoprotein insertase outer membrane protein LolB n=1 Tax=Acinetobacter rathckeae TaxID=2605272 RepID=UPI0018A2B93F|nr:lipoprotein insertase outer membrane protein LolB [Acinetobacter rathckeae]MBF7686858.1 outer membrane lipoprotein LolB [Acinetobacter rathckeae]MBF7694738.1 outer membrane lipoprotein LolB [Acinetobacter rathckeae]